MGRKTSDISLSKNKGSFTSGTVFSNLSPSVKLHQFFGTFEGWRKMTLPGPIQQRYSNRLSIGRKMSWITKFGSEFPMNAGIPGIKLPRKLQRDCVKLTWFKKMIYALEIYTTCWIFDSDFSTRRIKEQFKKIHNSKNRNCNMYHHLPPCAVKKLCFLLRPQLGHIDLQLHVVVGPKMKQQSNLQAT